MEEHDLKLIQENNTPEKREIIDQTDIQHRENVIIGDYDYRRKIEQLSKMTRRRQTEHREKSVQHDELERKR